MKLQLVVLFFVSAITASSFAEALQGKPTPPPGLCPNPGLYECKSLEYLVDKEQNATTPYDVVINWPKTETEVVKYCVALLEYNACVTKKITALLATCPSIPVHYKKLFTQVKAAMKTYYKNVCTNHQQHQQFIDRTKCYEKQAVKRGFVDAGLHGFLMGIIEKSKYKCCAALFFRDTVHELNKKNCEKKVTEDIHQEVKQVLGPIFHEECGKVKAYTECHATLPAAVQKEFDDISKLSYKDTMDKIMKIMSGGP